MSNHNHSTGEKNIKVAFVLNLSFTLIEFIGGMLTNSIAIMSDALHDLGDSFSLGLAWILEKLSHKSGNSRFSYGFKRLSLLGAFFNATILFIGSSVVIYKSLYRLKNPQMVNSIGMFLLAIFGVVINYIGYRITHSGKSLNEKMVSLHLLEDVLGWFAVFFVGIIIYINPRFVVLDPLLSIFIAIFIIVGVFKNLKETIYLFLQASPKEIDIDYIRKKIISSYEDVKDIHDIHVWSMDGTYHILSAHIVLEEEISILDMEKLKKALKEDLKSMHIEHATLEFEFFPDKCEDKKE